MLKYLIHATILFYTFVLYINMSLNIYLCIEKRLLSIAKPMKTCTHKNQSYALRKSHNAGLRIGYFFLFNNFPYEISCERFILSHTTPILISARTVYFKYNYYARAKILNFFLAKLLNLIFLELYSKLNKYFFK